MPQLLAILTFYRPFIIWSFLVNITLVIFNPYILLAIITKLFLIGLIWFISKETTTEQKLIFCNNLGVSNFKLFFTLFSVDIIITVTFIILIKEFI